MAIPFVRGESKMHSSRSFANRFSFKARARSTASVTRSLHRVTYRLAHRWWFSISRQKTWPAFSKITVSRLIVFALFPLPLLLVLLHFSKVSARRAHSHSPSDIMSVILPENQFMIVIFTNVCESRNLS